MKQCFYLLLFLFAAEMFSQDATYKNPIVDFNFPDPTVIKAADGYYYAYATNTEDNGKVINIQVLKSNNLIEWDQHGDAMPDQPDWASSDFWAPHVTYNKNNATYYLYYSGESNDGSIGKCMGVAVSDSPLGPFVDKGAPLLCGDTFINIDPMVFQDEHSGKNYLYWGSGHESIKVRELSSDLLNSKKIQKSKRLSSL